MQGNVRMQKHAGKKNVSASVAENVKRSGCRNVRRRNARMQKR